MRAFTREQLENILAKHVKWLKDEEGGERANLRSANLRSANLESANLESANLESANLESANLAWANLRSANLRSAKIRSASIACVKGKKLFQTAGGIGECGRSLTLLAENKWKWWIGWFSGTTEELEYKIMELHKENDLARNTMLKAVQYLKDIAELHGLKDD